MYKDPVQLSNDELGCPYCKVELTKGKSPFYFKGDKIGSFDSLLCQFCRFFVLTEAGFIESTKKMTQVVFDDEIVVSEK